MASFLTNDGVSIHYEISGSGRPLVMLHGWDQSAKAFCNILSSFKVIACSKYYACSIKLNTANIQNP